MSVESSAFDLFRELEQRIFDGMRSAEMSQPVTDHFSRTAFAKQPNPGRQVGSHPLVTASHDEVGTRQAVIQRHMAERLCRVNQTESQLVSTLNLLNDLPNW